MEDLEEWEVLSDDGFLEIHDAEGKKFFSPKYTTPSESVFKNYFTCPSPPKQASKFVESTEKADCRAPQQLIHVPIQLDNQVLKEAADGVPVPIEILNLKPPSALVVPEQITSPKIVTAEADQDLFSQVFFKKETEFVDMKLDSPKSNNCNNSSWGIKPQMVQFEEKGEAFKAGGETLETIKMDEDEMIHNMDHDDVIKKESSWDENSGGLNNILKWGLTGMGAICSFGVATVCIFVLGGLMKNTASNNKQHQQDQKLRFHIYAEDKRLKQVVHHATKLNEAISAVRGVPLTRAHITFGGYYDGV